MLLTPSISTLFPYTTLFRSLDMLPLNTQRLLDLKRLVVVPSGHCPRGCGFQLKSATSRAMPRSEEHTSELQSHSDLVCRLLLEKKTRYIKYETRTTTAPTPM